VAALTIVVIGLGLAGKRNRMDNFEITFDVKGTVVTVRRWRH
jgi:anti-sigma regulatory factor (Ser/Thr protein kinase)